MKEIRNFQIHPDLEKLIWVEESYNEKQGKKVINHNGITLSYSSLESSLLPAKFEKDKTTRKKDSSNKKLSFKNLNERQRRKYLEFLENPYNKVINKSFLNILYSALERHLVEGDIDAAIDIILKLRKVHRSDKFKNTSIRAIVLSCILRDRLELIEKLGLSSEDLLILPDNLFFLLRLTQKEPVAIEAFIQRTASFGVKRLYDYKHFNDIYYTCIVERLKQKSESTAIDLKDYFFERTLDLLSKENIDVFQKDTLSNYKTRIPDFLADDAFFEDIKNILKMAEEKAEENFEIFVGRNVVKMSNSTALSNDRISREEKELLDKYRKANSFFKKHCALKKIHEFYNANKKYNVTYLDESIKYCEKDISILDDLQKEYFKSNKKVYKSEILAFKRLDLIYRSRREYDKALDICKKAIKYYIKTENKKMIEAFKERKKNNEVKVKK